MPEDRRPEPLSAEIRRLRQIALCTKSLPRHEQREIEKASVFAEAGFTDSAAACRARAGYG
jgi:hypothetical protein